MPFFGLAGGRNRKPPACREKGCSRPAMRKSHQDMPARFTPYCSTHTCIYRFTNGARCTSFRPRDKDHCSQHTICTVSNCSRTTGDTGRDYCDDHTCTRQDCKKRRRYLPATNSYADYCDDHGCQEAGCKGARKAGSDRCVDHSCHAFGCVLAVKGKTDDVTHADNYCAVHQLCQTAGCTERVHDDPVNRARTRCYLHFCASGSPHCPEERAWGGSTPACSVCPNHKCTIALCPNAKDQPGGGDLCADHQCTSRLCASPRYLPHKFCLVHMCRVNLAAGPGGVGLASCDEEGDPYRNFRCAKHVECSESGCTNFCMTVNGVVQKKCDSHSKARCHRQGCKEPALDSSDVCREHVCGMHGCKQGKRVPSDYCALHKCSDTLCANPRDACLPQALLGPTGSLSPLLGLALAGGLSGPSAHANLLALAQGAGSANTLCSRHRCRAPGCAHGPASDASLFCHRHECQEDQCHNQVVDNGRFCNEHDDDLGAGWYGGAGGGAGGYGGGYRGYWGGGGGGGGRGIYSGRWPATRKAVRW